MRIRRGELRDKGRVFELAQQYTTGRETVTRDEFAVAFESVIREGENESAVLFVAVEEADQPNGKETSDRVVGYSLLGVSRLLHAAGLSGHLYEIVVDESARGRGVGEQLISANERYCAQRGIRQLSASTARFGRFYNHLGFEIVGEHFRKLIDVW